MESPFVGWYFKIKKSRPLAPAAKSIGKNPSQRQENPDLCKKICQGFRKRGQKAVETDKNP